MEQEYRKLLVRSYDTHIAYLLDGIARLLQQLRESGVTPVWIPEKMAIVKMPDFLPAIGTTKKDSTA